MCREMKDSGIAWIGDIPSEWKVLRLRFIGETKSGLANKKPQDFGHGYPFISYKNVYNNMVLDSSYPDLVNSTELDRQNYNVLKGDAFFTGSSETIEELGYASMCLEDIPNATYNGFVIRFRPYNFDYYNPEYMKYCFRSDVARGYLVQNDNSITRANLSQKTLKGMPIVIPEINEQQNIANYLDKKVSQIDDIISKQKSLIEKYKDYKQSLITETVTKGLNKNIPMKDSEIEWIGEIPSHWKVERIKYLIDFNPSYSENLNDDVSVSFAPMECIGNGYMNFKEAKLKDVKGKYTYFSDKDIIMAKVTPCFENGNIAIANDLINGVGFGSSELYVFRCKKVDNKFMFYYLQNSIFKEGCISTMTGTGGLKRVSASFIENYYIGIPKIDEQKQIAEFLDKKCNAINSVISKKQKLIKKLEAYKKSLIYECVTGKREVN